MRKFRKKVRAATTQVPIDPESPNRPVNLRLKGGQTMSIPRSELVRRAMAIQVAQRVMELADGIHVNEFGRRIILDRQWERIYADPSPDMRIIAGAQKGKTLYQLVKTMAQVSLDLAVGWVLPKENKIGELVSGKLDPTIENTEYYRELRDSATNYVNRTKFKTFGRFGRLHIVTANSETELTSFTADCMHVDERDFCHPSNLPMYPARMNRSDYRLTDEISTPTVDGRRSELGVRTVNNIHSEFLDGDQHRWFTRCPHCGHEQILDWYENIVSVEHDESGRIKAFRVLDVEWDDSGQRDIRVCCSRPGCGLPFDRCGDGRWRAMNPGARIRTYWVESLATSVGPSMAELVKKFTLALGNPTKMQVFHNQDLGRTYAGGHMRFTEELFKRCAGDYRMQQRSDGPCTIGIDVNRPWLDVSISQWRDGKQRKIFVGKGDYSDQQIVTMFRRFNIVGGVIDMQPETKYAMRLRETIRERTGKQLVLCKYATNDAAAPRSVTAAGERPTDKPHTITVNRTVAIDALFESMQTKTLMWFADWREACEGRLFGDFNAPTRRLAVSDLGVERYTWLGEPDHALHAAVYDQIAGDLWGMNVIRDLSGIGPFMTTIMHSSGGTVPDSLRSTARGPADSGPVMFMG